MWSTWRNYVGNGSFLCRFYFHNWANLFSNPSEIFWSGIVITNHRLRPVKPYWSQSERMSLEMKQPGPIII